MLAETPCSVLVVTGPFLPDEERRELRRLAKGLPVQLVTSVPDSMSIMKAADLIVAMAGYNTSAEVLALGKPALLIPRAGPSAEQRMRASRFAKRGWVRWLAPESLSPEAMAAAALEAMDVPHRPTDPRISAVARSLRATCSMSTSRPSRSSAMKDRRSRSNRPSG
jgi:predicted glycosyltransferase